MSAIVLLLMKASLLLAVAIVMARLIRGSAVRRHSFWSAAFACLLLLPGFGAILPSIEVSVPRSAGTAIPSTPRTPVAGAKSTNAVSSGVVAEADQFNAVAPPVSRLPSVPEALITLWLSGVVVSLGALVVSLGRVRALVDRGHQLVDESWRDAADRIAAKFGVRGPVRLIAHEGVVTPMAAGIQAPTIFLPANAVEWSVDRRDVVLAHEMAHLASRDPMRHLVSRIAMTLYWFHPLAWVASREATTACEQACDEAVLSLGVRPSAYAEILLDFASGARMNTPVAALPIVRRRLLETRLMAILDSTPRRGGRRVFIPAMTGVVLTLSIAAIRPTNRAIAAEKAASVPVAPTPPTVATAAPVQPRVAKPPVAKPPVAAAAVAASVFAAECERGGWNGDFSGTTTNSRGDGVVDRVVQRTYSDLRICIAGERMPRGQSRPSDWVGQAERLVLQTDERSGDVRRMETDRGVTTYSVNGRPSPIDANVREWQRTLVAAMDAIWEVNQLQGQVNSLRGEINSVHGERNSLQGEINSLQGEVNSMQGQINSVRGEENSMRGEINSINGELNSMRGRINSEQGEINSLRAAKYDRLADRDAIDARIRRHEDNIRRIEDEITNYNADRRIREVERRMSNFDAGGKVAEIERRIRNFDLEGKTADIRRRIAQLDVDGQVASIEREIQGLREADRSADLERRADAAIRELRTRLRR